MWVKVKNLFPKDSLFLSGSKVQTANCCTPQIKSLENSFYSVILESCRWLPGFVLFCDDYGDDVEQLCESCECRKHLCREVWERGKEGGVKGMQRIEVKLSLQAFFRPWGGIICLLQTIWVAITFFSNGYFLHQPALGSVSYAGKQSQNWISS